MKAAFINQFAEKGNLHIGQLSPPKPHDEEVCIAVAYAGVNPVDGKIAKGFLRSRLPHRFPIILGWEAAGTIHSVGKNIRTYKKGDPVYVYCRKPIIQHGTWAEYVTSAAEHVAFKPRNLTFAQAAAVPLAGLTSWQALFVKAKLRAKEKVLIHAGAGGVGGFAIEWAKNQGSYVITTASSTKHDYVKSLGADEIIDYQNESFVEAMRRGHPHGIDVVMDTVGGDTYTQSFEVLKPGGRIVSILEEPNQKLAKAYAVDAEYLFVYPDGKNLSEITSLYESNKVKLPLVQTFNLDQAEEAMELIRSGHVSGKIVLRIAENGK